MLKLVRVRVRFRVRVRVRGGCYGPEVPSCLTFRQDTATAHLVRLLLFKRNLPEHGIESPVRSETDVQWRGASPGHDWTRDVSSQLLHGGKAT